MTFLSCSSGIEAASVAWLPMGWRCVAVAEIDKFASAVLKHHYPETPNLGDINEYKTWPDFGRVDVVVGGTPCQDFSVAGQRAGMGGDRGQLTMRFLDIVGRYAPTWIVWENVPGVLSSDGRRAFGAFLGGLAQCGYGFAYRILDAQYSGLAQRRERVFVVGCSGGRWQRTAAVLFDAPRLRWNHPPRRETGKGTSATIGASPESRRNGGSNPTDGHFVEVAPSVPASGRGYGRTGESRGQDCMIPIQEIGKRCSGTPENGVPLVVGAVSSKWAKGTSGPSGDEAGNLIAFPHRLSGTQYAITENLACAVQSTNPTAVAFTERTRGDGQNLETQSDLAYAVTNPGSGGRTHSRNLYDGYGVRRLTPTEVERLFGFPDGYTKISWRGKAAEACPDSPRYRALGNSIAVPVLSWLARRIELVESIR